MGFPEPPPRRRVGPHFDFSNRILSTNVKGATIVNSSQTPIYDASGDVIDDGGNSYLYDAEGRVCAVQAAGTIYGYLYDAEGKRFAKGTLTSMSCDPAVNGFTQTAAYLTDLAGNQLTEFPTAELGRAHDMLPARRIERPYRAASSPVRSSHNRPQ